MTTTLPYYIVNSSKLDNDSTAIQWAIENLPQFLTVGKTAKTEREAEVCWTIHEDNTLTVKVINSAGIMRNRYFKNLCHAFESAIRDIALEPLPEAQRRFVRSIYGATCNGYYCTFSLTDVEAQDMVLEHILPNESLNISIVDDSEVDDLSFSCDYCVDGTLHIESDGMSAIYEQMEYDALMEAEEAKEREPLLA